MCGNDTELLTILVTLQRAMMQRPYGENYTYLNLKASLLNKSKFTRKLRKHENAHDALEQDVEEDAVHIMVGEVDFLDDTPDDDSASM